MTIAEGQAGDARVGLGRGRSPEADFLKGGGAAGTLLRGIDWTTSDLGSPETWPPALKTLVAVMLGANQPMLIVWGPKRLTLYNDGYAAMCGDRHPSALGRPFSELWFDIWEQVEPILDAAYAGQPTSMDDIQFIMHRNGYPEKTHFAFSYTPVRDETGAVAGMFCTCQETTREVEFERHARMRSNLGEQLSHLEEPAAIIGAITEMLGLGLRIEGGVAYGEVDAATETILVEGDWGDADFQSVSGRHRLDDYGPDMIAELRAGRTVVVSDVAAAALQTAGPTTQAYAAIDVQAFVNAPLIRGGRMVGVLSLLSRVPRVWTDNEVALAEEFAARTWSIALRRRAEQSLRQSEQQLRDVTDALPALIAIVDADERYRFNNKAYEDWFGRSREDIRGKTVREVLGEAAYAQLKPTIERVLAGERVSFEQLVPYKDGGPRHVRVDYIPRADADGRPDGWYAQIRDISSEKEAEEALEATAAELRTLFEAVPAAIWIARDPDAAHIDGNLVARRLLRSGDRLNLSMTPQDPSEAPTGFHILDAHGQKIGLEDLPVQRAARGEEVRDFEEEIVFNDGTSVFLVGNAVPLRDADGRPSGAVASFVDITERKRQEAALRDSEERLRLVQAAGGIGSFYWDMVSGIIHRSPEYVALQGLPADTPLDGTYNDSWLDRVHPDDRTRVESAFRDDVCAGGPFRHEYRIIRPDTGEVRWIANRGRVEIGADGAPLRLLSAQTDVTERVLAEAEKAAASAEARLWQTIVEDAGFGVAVAQAGTGHMVAVNSAFAAMHGYDDPSELIGRPLSVTYGPDAQAAVDEAGRKVVETGNAVYRCTHVRKDGSLFDCLTDVTAYRDEDGRITHGAASFIDISDLLSAQAALRESEEDFRNAAELNPQVAWTATPDGQLDRVAERWREWTGTSGLGDTWGQGLHPDDLGPSTEAWIRSVTTGEPYDIEHRVKRVEGEYRWARSRAYPRRDADAAVVRWYGNTEDIHAARVAQQELQESEVRFRNMADHAPVMMWVTDPSGYCTYLNKGWYDFTGQSEGEAEGFGWLDATHPDDKAMAEEAFVTANSNRSTFRIEYRLRRADGTYRWAIDAASPRFGPDGEWLGYVGSVFDIDERREAELALRDSELRFKSAVRAVEGVVWTNDAEGRMIGEQPGWAALTGQSREQYENYGWSDAVHPEDAPATVEAWNAAVAERRTFIFEHRVRRGSDRQWRRFAVRAIPTVTSDGEIREWVGVHTDVTELRTMEASLRNSEARFRSVAEAMPGFVWTADATGALDYTSARWSEYSGDGEGGAMGEGWASFVHPDDLEAAFAAWSASLASGELYEVEFRLRRRDGVYRWWLVRAVATTEESSQARRWIGSAADIDAIVAARDVLARSQAELENLVAERTQALTQTQDALRQSQKLEAMGQLTGGVAHDFNNLLTPIVGGLDLLHRRGVGDARERRLIEAAMQSAERARVLVQRLLAFARRQPLQASAVDLGALVGGMADIVASTSGPQIKVKVSVEDGLPAAMADPNQLEMAILNLSVNARDAMADGGVLTISAGKEAVDARHRSKLPPGDYLKLSVSDTGVGMDAATLARAIEPFYSTKGVGKGTGLGLSMVHGLASQLGGSLVLSSKPGLGTTVDFWLPISPSPAEAADPDDTAPELTGIGVALLVDDEELVRMTTADMLTDLGYRVVEADSAEAALQLLDGGLKVDVLVTDHLMPGMTGIDLVGELRGRGSTLPVLLVSGFAEAEGLAFDLPRLTKPFRQQDLAAALAGLGAD